METDIDELYQEVNSYLKPLDVEDNGEHLWSKYQEATAVLIRLTQIKTYLSYLELVGKNTAQTKKFRTAILEPAIEVFEKVSQYESRKITARQIEWEMEKR